MRSFSCTTAPHPVSSCGLFWLLVVYCALRQACHLPPATLPASSYFGHPCDRRFAGWHAWRHLPSTHFARATLTACWNACRVPAGMDGGFPFTTCPPVAGDFTRLLLLAGSAKRRLSRDAYRLRCSHTGAPLLPALCGRRAREAPVGLPGDGKRSVSTDIVSVRVAYLCVRFAMVGCGFFRCLLYDLRMLWRDFRRRRFSRGTRWAACGATAGGRLAF